MNISKTNDIILINAIPIIVKDIIEPLYFKTVERKRTISIKNNKLVLAKKMLFDLLSKNKKTFSVKPVESIIDILIFLRS
jgi:hypothetical protein